MRRRIMPVLSIAAIAGFYVVLTAQTTLLRTTSAAISGLEKIQTPTQQYNTSGYKEAKCSEGKKVIGGGYNMVGSGQSVGIASKGFAVVINRPLGDDSGWYVGWYAAIDTPNFWVNIYAICANAS